ncbi:MAG: choice-of-anchor I family protein [Acidobacteria bacterium]|nr:choice-of-anchor I family protein [Acidobacteriota bacterium]
MIHRRFDASRHRFAHSPIRSFWAGALLLTACASSVQAAIVLRPIGQYDTGRFDESAAEITAFDSGHARLFLINGDRPLVDALDLSKPWAPRLAFSLDIAAFGAAANSVAVHGDLVAVAVEAEDTQAPGRAVFYSTAGELLASVEVGSLPDMITFTPDGKKVLVANEGEPKDYCSPGLAADPEGSISVIDLSAGAAGLTQAAVTTAGFAAFNGGVPAGVRIFGPGATVAQDLEPEYITVSPDSRTAWISLQENNALAVLDLTTDTITALLPLGTKDHSLAENALDPSDRDGASRIQTWPVHGMYQPDGIATVSAGGETFVLTANEGDSRDYDCYSEETRVEDLALDPAVFPDAAALQKKDALGRLKTTTANGDDNHDGLFETIFSYGARSFSVWSADGQLVWDSGHDLELITAGLLPMDFNSDGPDNFDGRSDDKGPEPEGIVTGIFRDRRYAFIGLERVGGVMIYDVTDPRRPAFVQYATNRGAAGAPATGTTPDQGPEGLVFIPKADSPISRALLVVANEVSGTVTIYSVLPRTEE